MSTTTIADKFVRSDDFASRIDGIYLPDEAWAVFAQLEQAATVEGIARELELAPDAVLATMNVLLEHGLVRKHLRNWREFLAQKSGGNPPPSGAVTAPVAQALAAGRPGAALAGWPKPSAPAIAAEEISMPAATALPPPSTDVSAVSLPEAAASAPEVIAPSATAAEPPLLFSDYPSISAAAAVIQPSEIDANPPAPVVAPAAVPPPAPAAATPRAHPDAVMPVSFSLVNESARLQRRASTAMTISFRLAADAPVAAAAWRLNPLLKAIGQKAGGGLPGQLLVYRVFIHVPADMMHAAGIQSVSLVDDSVVIRDRAFYEALCQAAHAVAGIDLRTVKA